MKILAIDTSTIAASAAVMDENKLCGEFMTDLKLKHSEKLMFLIDGLLDNLRMNINDIDAFACGRGPGSFTGLRIAAAAVKGLAQPGNKPIIGVSSLAACAYAQISRENEFIIPIFDAQREEVYTGIYAHDRTGFSCITPDCIRNAEEYFTTLEERGGKYVFCGDGVLKYMERIKIQLGEKAAFSGNELLMPRASMVASLALQQYEKGQYDDYGTFMPEYIRGTDAQVFIKK
ncbi:MAG: tRNA (adenosine(37)-N6)-threonylcarbamoyltransferase complex dimerization subunit type 1 TsaB [Eubacteriales bacterium]|nr:tRNA (adenosine(37)-N6)-threonylcarbamoyltransferase complex dimerization subunit type 1 TsaB [Eubacteriales bacterium]